MFDRFPRLQIILGHWGEVILFYTERLASRNRAARLDRLFIDYVPYQYRTGRDARNILETTVLSEADKEKFAFANWERLTHTFV